MKNYIIDQLIQLVWCILVAIQLYIGMAELKVLMIIIELIAISSTWFLLKRIILLPIDFLEGSVEKVVYFSTFGNVDGYEFFRKKYNYEWKFYYGAGNKLSLLVPVCLPYDELMQMERPVVNQKIRVRYFRRSKILIEWESIN